MEKIISLAKQRGFVYKSSEIYGGAYSFYDYGPLGVELKNNIKKQWWKNVVYQRQDVVGLDSSILSPRIVWEASGHLQGFADLLVECKQCHHRFKEDELNKNQCPDCAGDLTSPKQFNLLMKTNLGVVKDKQEEYYLRGETCQGIYLNYLNVKDSLRKKLPFGIAQIGKAFRNEITPKNFIFRTREFEQMEMQYFVNPDEANKHYDEWKQVTMDWYKQYIVNSENLRWREHTKNELAHYAKQAWDIEYKTPFGGWKEFAGVHNRGDWDLSRHQEYSQIKMEYRDEVTNQKFTPWVVEVSIGVDRAFLMFLLDAYDEVDGGRTTTTKSIKAKEVVLRLDKRLAPIKAGILPLAKKPELIKIANQIYDELSRQWMCEYDQTGSIGKRYRRQDEIGTPYSITIDFDTIKDKQVTIRDRDTMKQERILINALPDYIREGIRD